jgi:monovalent cation/hydrogen antiporter
MEVPSVQVALSLTTPFAAYLAADHLHTSGIIAVVGAGIFAGLDDNKHLMRETRLKAWDVWEMLLFLFNGLVFLILGLELRQVLGSVEGRYSWGQVILYALAVSAVVILVRLAWMFPGSRIALWLNRIHYPDLPAPAWSNVFIGGWAGIRGAVTLAAALSLPLTAGDRPFPERDLIIVLATSVILVTLAFNGSTLPLLLRWLSIRDDGLLGREERAARVAIAHAAIRMLEEQNSGERTNADREFATALIRDYRRRVEHMKGWEDGLETEAASRIAIERDLVLRAIEAERGELELLRRAARINEQVLFAIQRDLDYREASVVSLGRMAADE